MHGFKILRTDLIQNDTHILQNKKSRFNFNLKTATLCRFLYLINYTNFCIQNFANALRCVKNNQGHNLFIYS